MRSKPASGYFAAGLGLSSVGFAYCVSSM